MLPPLEEDFDRVLAVVAHPDDLEYGAAAAIARWTAAGRWVGYVILTSGEAGMAGTDPDEARGIRRREQEASAAAVGVDDVVFFDNPDGVLTYDPGLREDITREVRRARPDVLLTVTERLTFPGKVLNQADHRAVALATFDAARDAGNPWIFPEPTDGLEPHDGVRAVLTVGSEQPTHGIDVSGFVEAGVASLECHAEYLAALGGDQDARTIVEGMTTPGGAELGVAHAVLVERFLTG